MTYILIDCSLPYSKETSSPKKWPIEPTLEIIFKNKGNKNI